MENYDFCKTQHLENPIADPRIGQSVPYQSVDILINSLPNFLLAIMTYMQKFKKDFLERYDVQIEQFKTVLGHLAMYIGEKSLFKLFII